MDTDIFDKLNIIFTQLDNSACSDEDRTSYETFLNEFIEDHESIFVLIQFLTNESNSEQVDFYAFAGLKKMIKRYWNTFSEEDQSIIIEKFQSLLFLQKKVTPLMANLFYSLIKSSSYSPLWSSIFSRCKEEISDDNCSIEKVEIIILNVLKLSRLIQNTFIGEPVSPDILDQFDEITSPFFDIELFEQKNGFSIVSKSIKVIVNLFGRSVATAFDESVNNRISELLHFFLNIYEAFKSISEINDQQLNFLVSCSSQIYELISCVELRNENKENIESYSSEWKPQIFSEIFELCLSIFESDKSKHFQISKIIRPLTLDNDSAIDIQAFFIHAIQFVSIPQDDLNDFFNYPDLYYQTQYASIDSKYGSLRNNTVLIYQNIFEQLSCKQIESLFDQVIQINEPEVFIVAKNAKEIIKKGASQSLTNYVQLVLQNFSSDFFFLPTALYLFSKSITAIPFNCIPQLINFNMNVLEHTDSSQYLIVPMIVGVYFFYKLKKSINSKIRKQDEDGDVMWCGEVISVDDVKTVFPDEAVMDILLKLIDFHIAPEMFSLIELIGQDNEDVYPLLVNLYEPLLKCIMDEIENYDLIESDLMQDKSRINMESMLSLLTTIVEHNSDSGIEEDLFEVLNVCLKTSSKFENSDHLFEIMAVLIKNKSEMSENYLNIILSFISSDEQLNEDGSCYDNSIARRCVLNFAIPLLNFMSLFTENFVESDLITETYKILVNIMNDEVVIDCYDNFGLIVLLTWIFQLQPSIFECEVDNDSTTLEPSFFFDYLESKNRDEESVCESAFLNLELTLILLNKIDLSVDFVNRWFSYIENRVFLRIVDVRFHLLALRYLLNQEAFAEIGDEDDEMKNSAIDLIGQIESQPDSFLIEEDKIRSIIKYELNVSNLDYPIFPTLQDE